MKGRETGENIANKIKYVYHHFFLLKNYRNLSKIFLKLKFYIIKIVTTSKG